MGVDLYFKEDLLQILSGLLQAQYLQEPRDDVERARREGYCLGLQAVAAAVGGSLLILRHQSAQARQELKAWEEVTRDE